MTDLISGIRRYARYQSPQPLPSSQPMSPSYPTLAYATTLIAQRYLRRSSKFVAQDGVQPRRSAVKPSPRTLYQNVYNLLDVAPAPGPAPSATTQAPIFCTQCTLQPEPDTPTYFALPRYLMYPIGGPYLFTTYARPARPTHSAKPLHAPTRPVMT